MRWGSDGQQIDDHRFIPADQRMANMPTMIWRPMPIKHIAGRCLSIPVPLYLAPHCGNPLTNLALLGIVAVEVLARSEQSLHQKSGFHQISTVVVFAEVGIHMPGAAIKEMRPHTVKAIRPAEKFQDL